jgi:hypothetical protein
MKKEYYISLLEIVLTEIVIEEGSRYILKDILLYWKPLKQMSKKELIYLVMQWVTQDDIDKFLSVSKINISKEQIKKDFKKYQK